MCPKKEHLPLLHVFSNLCQKAYCSWHLVASPVLAKVAVGLDDLFQEYTKGGVPPQRSKPFLLNKLVQYYVKGVFNYFFLLCYKTAHILSAQQTTIPLKKTVFIDTFFIIPNVLKGDDALGHYFPGIKQPIADAGWAHVILPRFYGTRSPFQFYKIFCYLQASGESVLTEFQLLTGSDYLRLLLHMIIYPWLIIGLFKFIPQTREGLFVRFALTNGLDNGDFVGAVRYLMARRLAPLLPEQARCLQWYENQTFERCFNRGLREAGATMPVYGAQLFLWAPEIVGIYVDSTEAATQKPDVILVNGPYYKHEEIDIPCKVGHSIRYARLFETSITSTGNKKTLVLLPYFESAARFVIELAVQSEPPDRLMFKFHPAAPMTHLNKLIPTESNIIESNLYDTFHEIGLLIGSASGALVEAAAVGIPVIVIYEKTSINYKFMPDVGRGLLWELASNAKQVQEAKAILFEAIIQRNDERMTAIEALRTNLFNCPTPDAILDDLDLREATPDHL